MGDRSQVCIKRGKDRIYLYAHWDGVEIYHAAARAIKEVPQRHGDFEYFARAVFCRMVPQDAWDMETGYGIGVREHGDTGHPIPVFDCGTGKVAFNGETMTFVVFAERALAGEFVSL